VQHEKNSTWCSRCVYVCLWIAEQTVTFSLYSINWLVLLPEVDSVYCAHWLESVYGVNQARFVSKGLTMKLVRTVPDLCSRTLRNFRLDGIKKKGNKITFLKRAPNISLREWKRRETKESEEYCWAITGGGAVMRRPISFHCIGVWISAGLPCVFLLYGWSYISSAPTCVIFN
jgi:hypothetical protein